jgi:drug/metabolite transporter (DMT)-like permease
VLIGLDLAARADPLWGVLVARAVSALAVVVVVLVVLPRRDGWGVRAGAVPALALIGILDTAANVLFAVASTLGLLSVVTVLAALYPVVTVVLARAVLRERVGAAQKVGVAAALGGVVLIAAG